MAPDDPRSLTDILADLQQAVADGELTMVPTTGTELREAQKRIEQLELLVRTVRSFGIGYLLQHGTEQLVLKPSDVTIVFSADQPITDLDLRARIAELEAQRDQVLALCDKVDVRYVNRYLRVEDVRAIYPEPKP